MSFSDVSDFFYANIANLINHPPFKGFTTITHFIDFGLEEGEWLIQVTASLQEKKFDLKRLSCTAQKSIVSVQIDGTALAQQKL